MSATLGLGAAAMVGPSLLQAHWDNEERLRLDAAQMEEAKDNAAGGRAMSAEQIRQALAGAADQARWHEAARDPHHSVLPTEPAQASDRPDTITIPPGGPATGLGLVPPPHPIESLELVDDRESNTEPQTATFQARPERRIESSSNLTLAGSASGGSGSGGGVLSSGASGGGSAGGGGQGAAEAPGATPSAEPQAGSQPTVPANPLDGLGIATHKLFDSTLYQPAPHYNGHVIPKLRVVYAFQMGINTKTGGLPTYEKMVDKISQLEDADIYCIDVEHWPIVQGDPDLHEKHIDMMLEIVQAYREVKPGAKIGFFGIFPRINYREARFDGPHRELAQTYNRNAARLAQAVDIIFPSVYYMEMQVGGWPSADIWEMRARLMVQEARQYGKPVFAFAVARPPGDYDQYWDYQLRVLNEVADATVIWSKPLVWDESHDWWQDTLQFLDRVEANATASYD